MGTSIEFSSKLPFNKIRFGLVHFHILFDALQNTVWQERIAVFFALGLSYPKYLPLLLHIAEGNTQNLRNAQPAPMQKDQDEIVFFIGFTGSYQRY
jgi:hypothetical protein